MYSCNNFLQIINKQCFVTEMDEEECERRRTECMENLADLERQFTLLREQ